MLEEDGVLDEFSDLGPTPVWWGAFRDGDVHSGHCWIELADGTIVDPTSRQFGLEECAVLPAGDPRYRR